MLNTHAFRDTYNFLIQIDYPSGVKQIFSLPLIKRNPHSSLINIWTAFLFPKRPHNVCSMAVGNKCHDFHHNTIKILPKKMYIRDTRRSSGMWPWWWKTVQIKVRLKAIVMDVTYDGLDERLMRHDHWKLIRVSNKRAPANHNVMLEQNKIIGHASIGYNEVDVAFWKTRTFIVKLLIRNWTCYRGYRRFRSLRLCTYIK